MNRVPHIMSAPRSGSTFIGQILKMVFGGISATHDYNDNYEVIVFRNFLDSAISHYRVLYDKETNFIITDKTVLDKVINDYSKYSNYIKKYVNTDLNKLYFVYELHIKSSDGNDYDTIFKMIEDYYGIIISNSTRSNIIKETNIEINKKRSDKLSSFTQWDGNTMIHGRHVHTGGHNIWKNHISEDLWNYYKNSILKEDYEYCLKKLGYG